jgi:hypothetical protein
MQAVAEEPRGGFSTIYRSAATRATVVTAALALIAFLIVLSIYHDIAGLGLVGLAKTGRLTTAAADSFDAMTAVIGYVYLAVYAITVIAFLAWLSRSVDNVPALGGGWPKVTPRWAIGWWFVPGANLLRPYQIVKDMSRRLALVSESSRDRLIYLWWLVWISANIAGLLPAGVKVNDLPSWSQWLDLSMYGDVLKLAAAILAIAVVRRIQHRANARAVTLGRSSASSLQADAG